MSTIHSNRTGQAQGKNLAFLLFLIWPFSSVFLAFWNRKASWSKNLVWAFMIFYGLTFYIVDDGRDATRYRDRFEEMSGSTVTVDKFIGYLFNEETLYVDFLQPLISFIVSRFTDDYHILFGVFGLIFGFFYSRNIWFLLDNAQKNLKLVHVLLLFVFAFLIGFWQINGFRFWTASHMFVYAMLPYLKNRSKKHMWAAFLAPLLHFSFLLPLLASGLYFLLGNRLKLYLWTFATLLLFSFANINFASAIPGIFPSIYEEKAEAYTNVDYLTDKAEGVANRNWYVNLYDKGIRFARNIIVFALGFFVVKRFRTHSGAFSIFNFGLLILSISLFFIGIGSVSRFLWIGDMFIFASYFLYLSSRASSARDANFSLLLSPLLLLFIVVSLRMATDSINATSIFANLFMLPFLDFEMALIDFIK